MKSLYAPSELTTQEAWLRAKYGDHIPDAHRNVVRLALTGQTRDSYSFFANNYVYIRDKGGRTTLLRPFVGQAIHRVALDSQLRAGLPGRLVEIKARQLGWTTECLARGLHFILDENKRAFILVDDEDVAAAQATDFNVMLNGLPKWMQPMRRIQSLKHLVFENPDPKDRVANPGLNSASQVTVPSSFRGVGGAIFVSIGEYAHMDETRQEAVNMGLISALGNNPYAILIIDTTPNGPGDSYHSMVLKACEQNPKWIKRIENYVGEPSAEDVLNGLFGIPDCVEKGRPGVMVPALCPWRYHEEYCIIEGMLVACKDGLKPIETIVVGDETTYGRVTDTFKFENRQVVRVTTEQGRSIVCTPTHPFWTPDGWIVAGNTLGKDVQLVGHQFGADYQEVGGISITNEMGRLLGYYMADGCLDRYGALSVACDAQDEDVVDDVKSLVTAFTERFPSRGSAGKVPIKPIKHGASACTVVRSGRLAFKEFFTELGGFDPEIQRRTPCVPNAIFRSPKPVVREFLRGLFEGDGYRNTRATSVEYYAKNVEFLRQVQLLLLGFGVRARIYSNDRTIRGKRHKGWKMYLRAQQSETFLAEIGFVSKRKSWRADPTKSRRGERRVSARAVESEYDRVVSVEDAGFANVYDISVADVHQYAANGILVHNTVRDKAHPRGQIARFSKAMRDEMNATLGKMNKYGGEEELEQRDRYGVSLERLFWRRCQIDNYELPSEESCLLAFRQEFLTTVESAFVDTGTTPFPRESMDALSRMIRTPAAVGLFESEGKFAHWQMHGEPISVVHRDPNPWQEIRIYAPPEPGEKYTMGIDTDVAYESEESDFTVAQVVRFSDTKLVATYTAKVGSHELMKQLYCLYRWYGNCYYAIETAGMGYDLVRRAIDAGMGNTHYYARYDADNPEPTKFPGWETAKPFMRAMMDQKLLELICHRNPQTGKAEPLCVIPDAKTVAEIKGLVRKPSGAFKSKNGHDDHVDAWEIAVCIAMSPYSGLSRREPEASKPAQESWSSQWFANSGPSSRNRPDLSRI